MSKLTSKRLRGKQRAWAISYWDATGFEPTRQEDYDAGRITFEEFKSHNLRWLEDYHNEVFASAEAGTGAV